MSASVHKRRSKTMRYREIPQNFNAGKQVLSVGNIHLKIQIWRDQMTRGRVRLAVFSVLTAIAGIVPANAQVLPHIAVGGSFTTEFLVINAGASAGTVTMSFFDDAGKPMALNFPELNASTNVLATKSPLP